MPRMRLISMLTMTAVSAIACSSAGALEIKTGHPRVLATASDIAALKAAIPTSALPARYGTVKLTFKPGERTTRDLESAPIFGSSNHSSNHLYIRHVDGWDTADTIGLQVGLRFNAQSSVFNERINVSKGATVSITIHYNNPDKFISLVVGGATMADGRTTKTWAQGWTPDLANPQKFHFVGRENNVVSEFKVLDGENRETWNGANVDWRLGAAYYFLGEQMKRTAAAVLACGEAPTYVCNVATGSRGVITETAAELGLAYQLTGEATYADAAKYYAALINSVPYGSNGEWSMGARVGALGLIYDWFHGALNDTEKAAIRDTVIKTIETDIDGTHMDLVGMICGNNIRLIASTTTLQCAATPDISRFYLSGHNGSAIHGTALGLLAIADGTTKTRVMPMIDTLYRHQVHMVGDRAVGFLPTREYISKDGGHQSLFAYGNGGELLERVRMWRTVQTAASDPLLDANTKFIPKLIKPYIYGLRKSYSGLKEDLVDGSFPASGDYFKTLVTARSVANLAIAAAVNGDGVASAFHEEQVARKRERASFVPLWERLYHPGTRAPARANDLPLAEHFSVAGNVLMRDTWKYGDDDGDDGAVLLDFKSTSFASENHQHLDQNSFSLFYRAPLLVDSGAYDDYYSKHWENYYRRTIAHNTIVVFDKDEKFQRDGTTFSNDGGQWYKGAVYPTLDELKPGGINALDGVTAFENGARYTYTVGNASKAYQVKANELPKLDPAEGFRRSILYLRQDDGTKPIILVHDRINSPKKLLATSLLHSVSRPETFGTQSYTGSAGRYSIAGSRNAPLRIRNGDGMVTVEPLLPKQATIRIVGGSTAEGQDCDQLIDADKTTRNDDDCRFTVRQADANGNLTWANFAPRDTLQTPDASDFGNWRIEIAPAAEGANGWQYQQFLNVLRVAPNDGGQDAPEVNTSTLLSSSDFSADAVALDAKQSVAFSTAFRAVKTLRFQPLNPAASVLVAGLEPGMFYSFVPVANSTEYAIVQQSGEGTGRHKSSPKGILVIPAGQR